MSAAALCTSLPYFHLGALDIGIPIQSFGVIVAGGVLIGAVILRRYAEWHGVSDEHIRKLLGWVTICGFLGAHVFDTLAYEYDRAGPFVCAAGMARDQLQSCVHIPSWWFLPEGMYPSMWPLPLRLWDGISSYGGFIGGAMGFGFYVWWKRLPVRLFADVTIVGLLPAFSIGRIGCTVVSDHIGAAVDRAAWYASLAINYPADGSLAPITELQRAHPEVVQDHHVLAWNLGLIEFLYLVPVNALVLFLAFRKSKPGEKEDTWIGATNAGLVTVITGMLYAPVRFGLDFLRPEETDPRHLGLTFAQWASLLAFGVAAYVAVRIFRNGAPAETVNQTAGETQRRLKLILREADDMADDGAAETPDPKKTVAGKPSNKK